MDNGTHDSSSEEQKSIVKS